MTRKATGRWEPWMGVAIALREDGMKQAELAARTSLSESDVSRIVNGKRDLYATELMEVAEVQGRDWSWYFEGPKSANSNRAKGLLLDSMLSELTQPVPALTAA